MGSINFAVFRMADAAARVEATGSTYLQYKDGIFRNTFRDIRYILETLGKGHGTKFEFECYDIRAPGTLATSFESARSSRRS